MFLCEKTRQIMSLYIDKQLTKTENEEFEQHIAFCANCKREFEILSMIVKSANNIEQDELPDQYSQQLHQKLVMAATSMRKKHNKIPLYLNWRTYSALAAGILLVIVMKSQLNVYDKYERAYIDDTSLNYIEDRNIEEKNIEDIENNNVIEQGKINEEQIQVYGNNNTVQVDNIDKNKSDSKYGQSQSKEKAIEPSKYEDMLNDDGSAKHIKEQAEKTNANTKTNTNVTEDIPTIASVSEIESFSTGEKNNSRMMMATMQLISNKTLIKAQKEQTELLWEYISENKEVYAAEIIDLDDKPVIMLSEEKYFELIEDFKILIPDLKTEYIESNQTQQYYDSIEQQYKIEEELYKLQQSVKLTKEEENRIQALEKEKDQLTRIISEIKKMTNGYIIEIEETK